MIGFLLLSYSPFAGSLIVQYSTMSLSMLPASPQIFHGREPQLDQVLAILQVDSPRLAILGMGGMGKTTLAAAALNHPDIVAKFSSRYFISCQSTATAADLVSLIASHIGIGRGSNPSAGVFQHFKDGPSTLLVLDNFETLWESTASQAKAEDFLSLLADVPHLALVVRGGRHFLALNSSCRSDHDARGRTAPEGQVVQTVLGAVATFVEFSCEGNVF